MESSGVSLINTKCLCEFTHQSTLEFTSIIRLYDLYHAKVTEDGCQSSSDGISLLVGQCTSYGKSGANVIYNDDIYIAMVGWSEWTKKVNAYMVKWAIRNNISKLMIAFLNYIVSCTFHT